MYVIRPQFFIPMITILRNAAQNSIIYKNELALVKAQNIDITNFEDELENLNLLLEEIMISPPENLPLRLRDR